METQVKMPRFTEEDKPSLLASRRKQTGEPVRKGEILFEVETEKVVSEVEAPADGILKEWRYEEGDHIAAENVVAVLSSEE